MYVRAAALARKIYVRGHWVFNKNKLRVLAILHICLVHLMIMENMNQDQEKLLDIYSNNWKQSKYLRRTISHS